MCKHGTIEYVSIINPNQAKNTVPVDACIAEEIQQLNDLGIITLGCCCGHGKAGHLEECENIFGKWKTHVSPPHALIHKDSLIIAKIHGYRPFPYAYAGGEIGDTYMMFLKTGHLTEDEFEKE